MIGNRTTPSRAFALACNAVQRSELSVRRKAETLHSTTAHVCEQLDRGTTQNSLGEVQNKGAMLDAAIGYLAGVRDQCLIAAAACLDDDGLLALTRDDWDLVRYEVERSSWLTREVGPFMPPRPDADECPAAGIPRPERTYRGRGVRGGE